jgi:hypothetical protein
MVSPCVVEDRLSWLWSLQSLYSSIEPAETQVRSPSADTVPPTGLGALMICTRCGSDSMRLSRMRSLDLVRLLLLQRPVRCHLCLHRRFVNVLYALTLRHHEVRRRPPGSASTK